MKTTGYEPLARIVKVALEERETRPTEALGSRGPLIVGIGGGVAVGKSTAAEKLVGLVGSTPAEVVTTDAYLLPNAVLEERDLLGEKGFPHSYDNEALDSFLWAVRDGATGLTVPVYDHISYDVLTDIRRPLGSTSLLVVEGVNSLRFAQHFDIAVYLHADEVAMEDWYVTRFMRLCDEAPPGSFYENFRGLGTDGREGMARAIWQSVNLVNLREHIAPTRANATVVVEKAADHSVANIYVTNP